MDVAAAPPPVGVVADLNAPNPSFKWNVLCQVVCLSISTIVFWLRLYTKGRIVGNEGLGPEDYACSISWVMLLVYGTVSSIFVNQYGYGQHIWNMSKDTFQKSLLHINVLEIVYGPTILFTKISILLLYKRIFGPLRKSRTWWATYTLLWFIVLFYTAVTLTKIFECTPRSKIWDKAVPGTCIDTGALLIVTGSINLATDVFILILPIFKVWGLKLSQKRRVGLTAVFALGSLAPIATAVRLQASVRYKTDPDIPYSNFGIFLWTVAEVATGIICASLPIIPAFFRHFYPKFRPRITTRSERTAAGSANPYIKNSRNSNGIPGNKNLNAGYARGYLELTEMDPLGSKRLVTTATGGGPEGWETEGGRCAARDGLDRGGREILKTVHIEQVGEVI